MRDNLTAVRDRMAEAARVAGRVPEEITLVAVAKRRPVEAVRALSDLGVRDVGENYPQELWEKVAATLDVPIRWHLIGHLQGNKAKRTLPMVRLVHGVDSLKLLRTLDDLAAGHPDPPGVCLQVNVSAEASKHGWDPESLGTDAPAIASCQHIPVVGLMTMAAYSDDPEQARPCFARLRQLRDALRIRTGLALPELSMGMSGDYQVAIEEGATLIRVGSALFEGLEP